MKFVPLGDQAVLAYCSDEPSAVRLSNAIRLANPPWLEDVVPAYASVGVFFNIDTTRLAHVLDWLAQLKLPEESETQPSVTHLIPVCYEFQLDLARIAEHTQLSAKQVIEQHLAQQYQVYAIGFVPGFPYLGYLPELLRGVGRLPSPRQRVEPGSVGLTGKQTGIYPLPRPGGWNILGRTPLTIVDVEEQYFPIRVGDRVQFTRISEAEYHKLTGERLANSSRG
jgi:inhibitor of KinA